METISQKGFTLIELMIVIMMIGIIALFGIPAYKEWQEGYRLNDGVRQVKSALMLAKAKAVKDSSPVLVEFKTGTGGDGWYGVFIDDGGGDATKANNGIFDNGETVFREGTMPKDVTLYNVVFDAAIASNGKRSAYFNTRGLPFGVDSGQPVYYSGQVYVSSGDKYRRISTSSGGSIIIEKSTVAEGGTWIE